MQHTISWDSNISIWVCIYYKRSCSKWHNRIMAYADWIRYSEIRHNWRITHYAINFPIIKCRWWRTFRNSKVTGKDHLVCSSVPIFPWLTMIMEWPVIITQGGFFICWRILCDGSNANSKIVIIIPGCIICSAYITNSAFIFSPQDGFSKAVVVKFIWRAAVSDQHAIFILVLQCWNIRDWKWRVGPAVRWTVCCIVSKAYTITNILSDGSRIISWFRIEICVWCNSVCNIKIVFCTIIDLSIAPIITMATIHTCYHNYFIEVWWIWHSILFKLQRFINLWLQLWCTCGRPSSIIYFREIITCIFNVVQVGNMPWSLSLPCRNLINITYKKDKRRSRFGRSACIIQVL